MLGVVVAERRVAGYEYRYHFSVGDANEMVKFYKPEYLPGKKTYLFEIRTSFIVKTLNRPDRFIDSERFHGAVYDNLESGLMADVGYRLGEYWMTFDEIKTFVHEAFEYAVQTANNPEHASRWLTCIVVDLEVRTVQQEGEQVDSVRKRVIRKARLVPYVIWPDAVGGNRFDRDMRWYLLMLMSGTLETGKVKGGQIRVENVEDGMEIMPVCSICLKEPRLGTFISVLPPCNHAFHSHCIAKKLLLSGDKFLCPTCNGQLFPFIDHPPLVLPQAP